MPEASSASSAMRQTVNSRSLPKPDSHFRFLLSLVRLAVDVVVMTILPFIDLWASSAGTAACQTANSRSLPELDKTNAQKKQVSAVVDVIGAAHLAPLSLRSPSSQARKQAQQLEQVGGLLEKADGFSD